MHTQYVTQNILFTGESLVAMIALESWPRLNGNVMTAMVAQRESRFVRPIAQFASAAYDTIKTKRARFGINLIRLNSLEFVRIQMVLNVFAYLARNDHSPGTAIEFDTSCFVFVSIVSTGVGQ